MSYLGPILAIIGIILAIIGGVLLFLNSTPEMPAKWWMWALLIGGIILFIIGLIVWFYGRRRSKKVVPVTSEQESKE